MAGRPIAALDIGTNSFHLVVARPVGGGRFDVLTREREVVRLGRGGGDMKRIDAEALDRGVAALTKMAAIAAAHDAELVAVATSATREAINGDEFIRRAAVEAGVEIDVISGTEEARLIHRGVLQAVPVFDRAHLVVDIGGGSTEVVLGVGAELLDARSFKLGAVRLTDRFFPGGVVEAEALRACRVHVRGVVEHFSASVRRHGFDLAIVSSGTAETLARAAQLRRGDPPLRTYNCFEFGADELAAVTAELTSRRTPSGRAKVAGIESGRADIIAAGAVILDVVAETFGVTTLTFSDAALREGLLADIVERDGRTSVAPARVARAHLRDVSRASVLQLVERCDDDPQHSAHVAELAVALFDELPELDDLGRRAREYLEAAALVANVGLVVAHSKHHRHTYYVVRNSELAGLTDAEIEIVALIARYHRKSEPRPAHPEFAALDDEQQRLVRTLAAVLRVAIGLDRRHDQRVTGIRRAASSDPQAAIELELVTRPGADADVELAAANERRALLEAVLGRPVIVHQP